MYGQASVPTRGQRDASAHEPPVGLRGEHRTPSQPKTIRRQALFSRRAQAQARHCITFPDEADWHRVCHFPGWTPTLVPNQMDGRIMRMMLRTSAGTVLTLAVMVPFVAGCSNLSQTQRGAIIGAAGGGAVGQVVGNAPGARARGASTGAAVGGAAGAIIRRQMEKQAEELAADLENGKVEQVGEGVLLTFDSGLLFDFDSDVIKGAAA